MHSRRHFLKTSTASLAGMAGWSSIPGLAAAAATAPSVAGPASPRFIFLRKSNGTFPSELVPPSLSEAEMKKEQNKDFQNIWNGTERSR